jgi:hypothetical protein
MIDPRLMARPLILPPGMGIRVLRMRRKSKIQ